MNEDIITTTDKIFFNILNTILEKLSEETKEEEEKLTIEEFESHPYLSHQRLGRIQAYEKISKYILEELKSYSTKIKQLVAKNNLDS